MKAALCVQILEALHNPKIANLVQRTLYEDLATFGVPQPLDLAVTTIEKLKQAGEKYPAAAQKLALEIYPTWQGISVREKYHAYNWSVERRGSAQVASQYVAGKSLLDLGGGPGTFAIETLKLLPERDLKVTIADIADWRNDQAKASPNIDFKQLEAGRALPFRDQEFDSLALLYVLHHVESDHDAFLLEVGRVARKAILIFEDVKVDLSRGRPQRAHQPARDLEEKFLSLSLEEQHQFIALVDYICNHIASQALGMPVPGKYYEYRALTDKLKSLFPRANVISRYHGIHDQKTYPNPEALYVVQFDEGAK